MGGMAKRTLAASWARAFSRGITALNRQAVRAGSRALAQVQARAQSLALKAPKLNVSSKAVTPPLKARQSKSASRPPSKVAIPAAPRGDWLQGLAAGAGGTRRFHLYRPAGLLPGERLPLLVMLHGCGQTVQDFALSTRMNGLAARQRFFVLYPEQNRQANSQGCWNWFDTRSGRAWAEVESIMNAVDQVCQRHPVDRGRLAVAGLSAGASMAALLATRHADRFKAVVMHSGVPPGAAFSAISALRAMRGQRAAAPALPPAPARPWPPLLVIQGRLDTVVDASNGRACAELWATAAGAHASAVRSVQRGERYPMSVYDYVCDDKSGARTVARLIEVQRLGHAWSGGAAAQAFSDSGGPDASRLLWTFVSRQFTNADTKGTPGIKGRNGPRRTATVAPLQFGTDLRAQPHSSPHPADHPSSHPSLDVPSGKLRSEKSAVS